VSDPDPTLDSAERNQGGTNSLERAAQEADASERFVVVRPDQVLGPPGLECHISDVAKVDDLLLLQAAKGQELAPIDERALPQLRLTCSISQYCTVSMVVAP
jgi:hypothetical protein